MRRKTTSTAAVGWFSRTLWSARAALNRWLERERGVANAAAGLWDDRDFGSLWVHWKCRSDVGKIGPRQFSRYQVIASSYFYFIFNYDSRVMDYKYLTLKSRENNDKGERWDYGFHQLCPTILLNVTNFNCLSHIFCLDELSSKHTSIFKELSIMLKMI